MRLLVFALSLVLLSGCAVSPPKPPAAEGQWVELNTTSSDILF